MKYYKFYEKNMKKYVKTQEKTQNSRWKLKKSALLGFQGGGKASESSCDTRSLHMHKLNTYCIRRMYANMQRTPRINFFCYLQDLILLPRTPQNWTSVLLPRWHIISWGEAQTATRLGLDKDSCMSNTAVFGLDLCLSIYCEFKRKGGNRWYQELKALKELDFHGLKGAFLFPQPFSF